MSRGINAPVLKVRLETESKQGIQNIKVTARSKQTKRASTDLMKVGHKARAEKALRGKESSAEMRNHARVEDNKEREYTTKKTIIGVLKRESRSFLMNRQTKMVKAKENTVRTV